MSMNIYRHLKMQCNNKIHSIFNQVFGTIDLLIYFDIKIHKQTQPLCIINRKIRKYKNTNALIALNPKNLTADGEMALSNKKVFWMSN